MEAAIVTTIANSYNSSSSTSAHLILPVAHPVRGDLVNSRRFLRCRSCEGLLQALLRLEGDEEVTYGRSRDIAPWQLQVCMSTWQALHRRKLKLCKFKEKTVKSLTCRWSEYLGGCVWDSRRLPENSSASERCYTFWFLWTLLMIAELSTDPRTGTASRANMTRRTRRQGGIYKINILNLEFV